MKCSIAHPIFTSQANTEKPEWSEEEMTVREDVLTNLGDAGGYEEAGLKKQIMVDRSAPVVGGQYFYLIRMTQILGLERSCRLHNLLNIKVVQLIYIYYLLRQSVNPRRLGGCLPSDLPPSEPNKQTNPEVQRGETPDGRSEH